MSSTPFALQSVFVAKYFSCESSLLKLWVSRVSNLLYLLHNPLYLLSPSIISVFYTRCKTRLPLLEERRPNAAKDSNTHSSVHLLLLDTRRRSIAIDSPSSKTALSASGSGLKMLQSINRGQFLWKTDSKGRHTSRITFLDAYETWLSNLIKVGRPIHPFRTVTMENIYHTL